MRPPIFIVGDGDVSIFRSPAEAERYLEWPDVEDQLYAGYDVDGRVLRVTTTESQRRWLFGLVRQRRHVVRVYPASPETFDQAALIKALRAKFEHFEPGSTSDALGLEDLRSRAIEEWGYS